MKKAAISLGEKINHPGKIFIKLQLLFYRLIIGVKKVEV